MKEADLGAILSAKESVGPCPFCQTNLWIAETTSDSEELAIIAVVSTGEVKKHAAGHSTVEQNMHKGYLLTCKKCGFMRLHNKTVIEAENG